MHVVGGLGSAAELGPAEGAVHKHDRLQKTSFRCENSQFGPFTTFQSCIHVHAIWYHSKAAVGARCLQRLQCFQATQQPVGQRAHLFAGVSQGLGRWLPRNVMRSTQYLQQTAQMHVHNVGSDPRVHRNVVREGPLWEASKHTVATGYLRRSAL